MRRRRSRPNSRRRLRDALDRLINEAAAHQLADQRNWSSLPGGGGHPASLEDWVEPIAAEAERAMDGFAERLVAADVYGLPAQEFDSSSRPPATIAVRTLRLTKVSSAASSGPEEAGPRRRRAGQKGHRGRRKVLPIGLLLNKLKGLVGPLLKRVISSAMNRLPASIRPFARQLAAKLGVAEAEAEDQRPPRGWRSFLNLKSPRCSTPPRPRGTR